MDIRSFNKDKNFEIDDVLEQNTTDMYDNISIITV